MTKPFPSSAEEAGDHSLREEPAQPPADAGEGAAAASVPSAAAAPASVEP